MCGRFNIIDDPLTQLLIEITGQDAGWSLSTEFNIAPTQTIPVLCLDAPRDEPTGGGSQDWALRSMRWWLVPYWASEPSTKYSMFNARSETLATSRAFREPFKRRRCIIPASGYYEWQKGSNKQKLPFYMTPDDDPGFAFAGLWDRWEGDGQVIESCTMVTTAAPDSMKHIHHRIPVHLTTGGARQWVSGETALETLETLMAPAVHTAIRITPVSTLVNNARNKESRVIEPLDESTIVLPDEPDPPHNAPHSPPTKKEEIH